MRLVYHMYGKIGDGPIKENYKEDIISEGMLGLCKAAHTFDESRGVRFSTYAAMCIRNAMLMFIRKTKSIFHGKFRYTKQSEEMPMAKNSLWRTL